MQFRYFYFLCPKTEKKKLMKEFTIPLTLNYPKESSMKWKCKNSNGKW